MQFGVTAWTCIPFLFIPAWVKAGVVLTSTLGINTNPQGKIIGQTSSDTNGAGLVFKTGGGSAWDLKTIKLAITTGTLGGYTYSGGTVSFYLYRMGSGVSPLTANSLTYVGTTSVTLAGYQGNAITKTFDLSGFDNLSASTQYLLGINATGYTGDQKQTNDFLKISGTGATPTAANSSGWSVSTNYSFMLANFKDAPTGTNNFSSSTTSVAYQFTSISGMGFEMDATAVPEPSTLVLFCTAIMAGIMSAYWNRRKPKIA